MNTVRNMLTSAFLCTSKEKGVPFLNELSRTVPPTGIGAGNRPAAKWFPAGQRAGVPLWPDVCPMPAGGSAVKGRQRDRWLPVAERASPLTALQVAGTHARRAKVWTGVTRYMRKIANEDKTDQRP